ncbi:hypothetical protein D3C79_919420 [compost metagenome]
MVEHGDQRADEDDQGQHPHREDEAVARQIAEHEADATVGKAEQGGDAVAHGAEQQLTGREVEHQGGEAGLQGQGPEHGAPTDGAAVLTGQPGDKHQGQHADQTQ